ncbi:PfkB family carbohydrate kinase [Furfurilactobacillus sp. WILCCON 0119]|uniref:PfkB family carbohydrate kinase n=1 Tax=Furfurilactobacillus entadae TaxID=2922307 RepID=UPI0035EA2C14
MNHSQSEPTEGYVVVIGGMNMDIFGMPREKVVERDSNPGVVGMSVGGVGQNIAQNLAHLDVPTYLITVYGDDYNGQLLAASCEKQQIHLDYAEQEKDRHSSTYMYITDETGDMLVGVNDMDICQQITPAFLEKRLSFINQASICLLDANLNPETLNWIGNNVTAPLFGDTVSTIKAHHFDGILDKLMVLKPNALEASLLTGIEIHDTASAHEAGQALLDRGVQNVFISLGAAGILCANHDETTLIRPFNTTIVNANGAGDCGMAAITWSYFTDPQRKLNEVGRIAQAASSIALESTKSVPDITTTQLQHKLTSDVVAN